MVSAQALDSIPLLGVQVHRVTMEQVLEMIDEFIREGGAHHVVTLDASMCVIAREDPDLRQVILNSELVTPDSTGVLWACRRLGRPLPERVSGVEIVQELCRTSAECGHTLFFLGAAPGVADAAAERMRQRYPGCLIVGTHDGYFTLDNEPEVLHEIRLARPDILCVAMGIPKQERWIACRGRDLGVPVMIGVGGTFDVLSGKVKRAPGWVQRLNLEWLYRLARNPRKIGKVLTLPRFVWLTLNAGRESKV